MPKSEHHTDNAVMDSHPSESDPFDLAVPVSTPLRKHRRVTTILYAIVGLAILGTILAVIVLTPKAVDPNAPRVTLQVEGLHCPIQCGLRVSSSLEKIPWVIPGSVTANPATGEVTFAVSDRNSVNRDQLREAIEQAGFSLQDSSP